MDGLDVKKESRVAAFAKEIFGNNANKMGAVKKTAHNLLHFR